MRAASQGLSSLAGLLLVPVYKGREVAKSLSFSRHGEAVTALKWWLCAFLAICGGRCFAFSWWC